VIEAANSARLVTDAGFTHRSKSGFSRALASAIDLAMIAVAADQYLGPATSAQEESA
jgi:hypothetical protein